MNRLLRILLFVGLLTITVMLFLQAQAANRAESVDASKIVMLFVSVVIVGGATAVLFVVTVMPSIGDAIGNLFFQPNEQVERDPHADAQAALARGDHAAAVEEYRKLIEADPTDILSYSEVAKITCENLEDPPAAAQLLEEALQREWSPDDAAFLTSRLVDVYWKHQHDARSARALLLQVIEAMPGTRHAANAEHRLREIEQQLSLEG